MFIIMSQMYSNKLDVTLVEIFLLWDTKYATINRDKPKYWKTVISI